MEPEEYAVDSKGRVVVPINSFSDGDPQTWPYHSNCTEVDATLYLEKLGTQWMKSRGKFQQGQYLYFLVCGHAEYPKITTGMFIWLPPQCRQEGVFIFKMGFFMMLPVDNCGITYALYQCIMCYWLCTIHPG